MDSFISYTPFSLSARLFEVTGDPKYQQAAELSAEFVKNHLYNGITSYLVQLRICNRRIRGTREH
jgi:hypothetical protein